VPDEDAALSAPEVPAPEVPPELAALRVSIDALDREILRLFTERARLVIAVGDVKRAIGRGVSDPSRERAILDGLAARAESPVDAETVRRVFERVIDESRRIEQAHVASLAERAVSSR